MYYHLRHKLILNPLLMVTLDKTTYNWSWLNTGDGEAKADVCKRLSLNLIYYRSKVYNMENCLISKLIGNVSSDGFIIILQMKTFCSALILNIIFARWCASQFISNHHHCDIAQPRRLITIPHKHYHTHNWHNLQDPLVR